LAAVGHVRPFRAAAEISREQPTALARRSSGGGGCSAAESGRRSDRSTPRGRVAASRRPKSHRHVPIAPLRVRRRRTAGHAAGENSQQPPADACLHVGDGVGIDPCRGMKDHTVRRSGLERRTNNSSPNTSRRPRSRRGSARSALPLSGPSTRSTCRMRPALSEHFCLAGTHAAKPPRYDIRQ